MMNEMIYCIGGPLDGQLADGTQPVLRASRGDTDQIAHYDRRRFQCIVAGDEQIVVTVFVCEGIRPDDVLPVVQFYATHPDGAQFRAAVVNSNVDASRFAAFKTYADWLSNHGFRKMAKEVRRAETERCSRWRLSDVQRATWLLPL